MKKNLIAFALIASMLSPMAAAAQAVSCKIKGSETCLPATQKLAEVFGKKNSGSNISVTGGGSGVGIAAIMSGTTDIAQSSRKMKMDEKMKLQESGKAVKEFIFANDALSVVVNPGNPINKLTREQLEAIFTGKIKNWKELGGKDLKIIVYSRETSSGTYEFFKESVLKKKNFATTSLLMAANGPIVQSISQTPGAIGYIGMAYVEKTIKALNVSYDGGKTYVAPTMANAMNKTYPITRPLYLYFIAKREAEFKPLLNFILSAEGQNIVKAEGYIPLSK